MKTIAKIAAIVLAACTILGAAACSKAPAGNNANASAKPTNTDAAVKPVMLVVSFGTSYNDSREITIGAIENALKTAFPAYEIRRAFTSQIIIDKLKERDNLAIDNVKEAMDRLVADGVKELVIQPTHVMPGFEYNDIKDEIKTYESKFDSIKFGKAMLETDADFDAMITALTKATESYKADDTAIVFMGHGTEHEANNVYTKLQEKLNEKQIKNFFIGTVEAAPTLEDVVALCKQAGVKKVVLQPLMIVAGDHANNDMAGDEEDSWKTVFTNEGFEVECVIKGLGELPEIQQLIVEHAKATIGE